MFIWTFFSQWPIISPPKILTFPPESHCTRQGISSTRPCRPVIKWKLQWPRVTSVHCPLQPVTVPHVHIFLPRRISCLRGWHGHGHYIHVPPPPPPPTPTGTAFRLPADLLRQFRTMDCRIANNVSKIIAILFIRLRDVSKSPRQHEPF
jgi:hypothetical protein